MSIRKEKLNGEKFVSLFDYFVHLRLKEDFDQIVILFVVV